MVNRGLLLVLLGLFVLALAGSVLVACEEDEVELPQNDTGDLCAFCTEEEADDDAGDDDDDDDDDADDDAGDDDDDTGDDDDDDDDWAEDEGGPTISDAAWNPEEVSLGGEDVSSTLSVYICDAENDLLVGETWGDLYVWNAGTSEGFLTDNPMSLSGWSALLKNGTDCAEPTKIAIKVGFSGAPMGEYCADLGATDGNGNRSAKLTNICVTIVP